MRGQQEGCGESRCCSQGAAPARASVLPSLGPADRQRLRMPLFDKASREVCPLHAEDETSRRAAHRRDTPPGNRKEPAEADRRVQLCQIHEEVGQKLAEMKPNHSLHRTRKQRAPVSFVLRHLIFSTLSQSAGNRPMYLSQRHSLTSAFVDT